MSQRIKKYASLLLTAALILCAALPAAAKELSPGDVNGDGRVNSTDARLALRAAARLDPLTDAQAAVADMNGDGKVRSDDARVILRIAAKLDPSPADPEPATNPPVPQKNATLAVLDAKYVPNLSDVVRFTSDGSEYAARAVIFTDVPVRNLRVVEFTDMDWSMERGYTFGTKELFRLAAFTPEHPLLLTFTMGEIMPVTGISYTDTDGAARVLALSYNGDDGSVCLMELD